jgi:hypothetical protein
MHCLVFVITNIYAIDDPMVYAIPSSISICMHVQADAESVATGDIVNALDAVATARGAKMEGTRILSIEVHGLEEAV